MRFYASLSDMFRKDVYAADEDDIAVNAYYQQRASSIIRQNKVARNKLIPHSYWIIINFSKSLPAYRIFTH